MKPGEPFNPWRMFDGVYVPFAVLRCPDLSAGAKLAYGRLARYAGENGKCYPSLSRLGHELGVSRDSAQRYVRELIAAGLIRTTPRTSASGDPDTHDVVFLWHLLFESEEVGAELPPPGRGENAPTVGAELPGGVGVKMPPEVKKYKVKQGSERKTHAGTDAGDVLADAHFEEFWSLYPRKSGKKPARDSFRRKVTTESTWERVRAAVVAQAPAMLASEPRFRPMASTWLNQERWSDEPEVPAQGTLVPIRQPFDRHAAHEQRVTDTFRQLIAERLNR